MKKMIERNEWVAVTLQIQPCDQILEIGCGHGNVISLIVDRLSDGKITAIDSSSKMIQVAEKKNATHILNGKVEFVHGKLSHVELNESRFNKIFAVNVNLFWMDAARDLAIVKECLLPGGSVYIFNQPPVSNKIADISERTQNNLLQSGFQIKQMLVSAQSPVPMLCIIAASD